MADVLRGIAPMDPTEALRRLQVLVQSEPDLRAVQDDYSVPPETLKWLGQLHAVTSQMKRAADEISLRAASDRLMRSRGRDGSGEIRAVLYRVLAAAELSAPASEQGAFIAAGNELDAYAAISKVLASAKQELLIVDPYMDGKALTDFMASAAEGVLLRVLADEASVKPTLAPAAEKWKAQFGTARPLEVRVAPARSLHDRLIVVDEGEAWSLTQSFKDFANRAPGAVMKADAETAVLKIAAYMDFWNNAGPL
ncbi:phosphatidylserine/phosphatidylglycerophosphate/cardiolipin synthase family protein [Enterovirga sp. GCM10030262]|uniref:phosphatidylserine/phosphatidylglycerophosphate/ cardiolipin synthase family protein n=1 Tax=Enterovirga sp. GCM10030262 TaxID=3273391 RepID=UPI003614276B